MKFPNKTLLCYQKRKLTEKRLVQITTYAFSGSIHTISLLVKYFIISFNNIHWALSNNYIDSHTYTQLSILNNSKHLCFPVYITYNIILDREETTVLNREVSEVEGGAERGEGEEGKEPLFESQEGSLSLRYVRRYTHAHASIYT